MASKIELKVDPAEFGGRISRITLDALDAAMDDWADRAFLVSQLKVPVDKANLARSGEVIVKPWDKIVRYHADYCVFVEYGTGVYGEGEGAQRRPIRPRNKKVLAWVERGARPTTPEGWAEARKEGRAIIAREISGMKPQPFMRPAFDEATAALPVFFSAQLEKRARK